MIFTTSNFTKIVIIQCSLEDISCTNMLTKSDEIEKIRTIIHHVHWTDFHEMHQLNDMTWRYSASHFSQIVQGTDTVLV